jgi:hypothetical protein
MFVRRSFLQIRSRLAACSVFAALTSLMLTSLVGCGGGSDEGPQRFDVSGSVKFDGQPVPTGMIYFDPAEGNSGPQGFAAIVDGEFDTSSGKGTVGGAHTARIEGADSTGKPIFVPHFEEVALPKSASTQAFEIPASAADKLQTDAEPV